MIQFTKGKITLKKRFLALFFVFVLTSISICSALDVQPYASAQLSRYSASAVAKSNGEIAVAFVVEGTGIMSKLGLDSVVLSEYTSGRWVEVETYNRSDFNKTRTNAVSYTDSISLDGESGVRYKIDVTVFATNASGTDYGEYSCTVTAK